MGYSVGEVAKMFDLAPSTLRYYDKEGLLPFIERSTNGIRRFKNEDLAWLKTIECLKKTGLSIKEIKQFIDYCVEGDSRIDERLAIMKAQRDAVIKQMEEMQEMLDMLDYKCMYYAIAKEAGTCSVPDNMPIENIPEKYHKFITKE